MIEDTESTVDLAFRGLTLRNYPDRLAFSATPPDFGSLLIQQHRWANGRLADRPEVGPACAHATIPGDHAPLDF